MSLANERQTAPSSMPDFETVPWSLHLRRAKGTAEEAEAVARVKSVNVNSLIVASLAARNSPNT